MTIESSDFPLFGIKIFNGMTGFFMTASPHCKKLLYCMKLAFHVRRTICKANSNNNNWPSLISYDDQNLVLDHPFE